MSFQGASNKCWCVAFHSVLTRQRAAGFHSWLWRLFSARPGASIDCCVFGTLSIKKILVATDAPFQDASNEWCLVPFTSVLTRQRTARFHSWWRQFSAGPGASINCCVFVTWSIEKIFVAKDVYFQDAFKKCLFVGFHVVSTIQ